MLYQRGPPSQSKSGWLHTITAPTSAGEIGCWQAERQASSTAFMYTGHLRCPDHRRQACATCRQGSLKRIVPTQRLPLPVVYTKPQEICDRLRQAKGHTFGGVTGCLARLRRSTVLLQISGSIQPKRNDMSAAMTMPAATASPCNQTPAVGKTISGQLAKSAEGAPCAALEPECPIFHPYAAARASTTSSCRLKHSEAQV